MDYALRIIMWMKICLIFHQDAHNQPLESSINTHSVTII